MANYTEIEKIIKADENWFKRSVIGGIIFVEQRRHESVQYTVLPLRKRFAYKCNMDDKRGKD